MLDYVCVVFIGAAVAALVLTAITQPSRIRDQFRVWVNSEWIGPPDCERTIVTIQGGRTCDLQQLVRYPSALVVRCSNNQLVSLNGLQFSINLQILEISNNRLGSLRDIGLCTNLRVLKVSNNSLWSLRGIEACTSLRELHCNQNELTSLQGIEQCLYIETLYCNNNRLTSVVEVANCIALKRLDCSHNALANLNGIGGCNALEYLNVEYAGLTTLSGIEGCTSLLRLHCGGNLLESVRQIRSFPQLTLLYCQANRLTTLEGINLCSRLVDLQCHSNQLTSIDGIANLRRLQNVCARNNPVGILPQPVRVVLQRLGQRRIAIRVTGAAPGPVRRILNNQRIVYDNNQNTHDTDIMKTVHDSLSSLQKDHNPRSLNIDAYPEINMQTRRILRNACRYECTYHGFTYEKLLKYVLQRITISKHRAELFRILEIEVRESKSKCFTGQFNSLLSVLVGFYDDINIGITDSSRIGIIILTIKKRIKPYDPIIHQQFAQRQLLEMGYSPHEIAPWLNAITEDY